MDSVTCRFQELFERTILAQQLDRASLLNLQLYTKLAAFERKLHGDIPEACRRERNCDRLKGLLTVEGGLRRTRKGLAFIGCWDSALNPIENLLCRR